MEKMVNHLLIRPYLLGGYLKFPWIIPGLSYLSPLVSVPWNAHVPPSQERYVSLGDPSFRKPGNRGHLGTCCEIWKDSTFHSLLLENTKKIQLMNVCKPHKFCTEMAGIFFSGFLESHQHECVFFVSKFQPLFVSLKFQRSTSSTALKNTDLLQVDLGRSTLHRLEGLKSRNEAPGHGGLPTSPMGERSTPRKSLKKTWCKVASPDMGKI